MTKETQYTYPGKDVDVHWDGELCIHIGECGRAKGELFTTGRKPWCQPDMVDGNNVVEVVKRCPSGALSYQFKDNSNIEIAEPENNVLVSYNGPLYFSGDLQIEGASSDAASLKFRAALCRCGASNNKPFCDNSHLDASFSDYGAVGETGETLSQSGGELNVTPLQDGPLMVKGNLSIKAASGRTAWQGQKVALCRCGASNNKPFCDGAHTQIGFKG